jgi:hypothetical protein
MRLGYHISKEGTYVKDLGVVIRDGESLLDVILVEDDPSYIAHDQEPCMYIVDLLSWYLAATNQAREVDHFPKNSIYYMLGLFKTYFEHEKYKKLPLRAWLDQILPEDMEYYSSFFRKHPFVHNMIDIGLSEVQKQVPDAILYKSRELIEQSPISADQSGVKISKKTKYESFVRHLIIGNIPLSMRYLAEHLFEMFQSSEIEDAKQPVGFYQGCIVNLIESLNDTERISIDKGTKIYDVRIIPTKKFDDSYKKHITSFLSFIYVPNEEALENIANIALEHIQNQFDIKKSAGYTDDMPIVSVGIAFSAKSFLAAYTYKECGKIHLTDTYNYASLY